MSAVVQDALIHAWCKNISNKKPFEKIIESTTAVWTPNVGTNVLLPPAMRTCSANTLPTERNIYLEDGYETQAPLYRVVYQKMTVTTLESQSSEETDLLSLQLMKFEGLPTTCLWRQCYKCYGLNTQVSALLYLKSSPLS